MVFESLVVDILNTILGDYIENLDTNQLSIGIWGGDVVLQDLLLKETALEDLNLPIQTVYGRLSKLVLKIPWKNLYGAPVEAAIEKLYLLIVPNQEVKYDSEKEEKLEQYYKQAELSRIENARKTEEDEGKNSDDTFIEKLTTQVIKNVQVRIQDIHIRYEDTVTNPRQPFAFGITLSNLSVETTNDQWQPAIITDTISKIYKMLHLDALAVYWNCNCFLYSTMDIEKILKFFQDGIATRTMKPEDYLYILGPINSSAQLRLNPKPENDHTPFSTPKVFLNLLMEKLAIGISKKQYHDIMLLAESMDRMKRGIPYRKYRPFVPSYRGHYHAWWLFAVTCVMEEEVRRRRRNWDWDHISQHRALCRDYAEAYQTKLLATTVPEEVQTRLEEAERNLDVFNLVIIRQRIELEVARMEKKKTTEEVKKKGNWFSGWFGGTTTVEDDEPITTTNIIKKFEEAMTPEEKSKLYRAIDYQENSAPAVYPESFAATSCTFMLRCLEVDVRDDELEEPCVLKAKLLGVNCGLQQRPAASAFKVVLKIDQFTVFGLKQGDVVPYFVSSEDLSENEVLLDVLFETNPLEKKCDQRLHVQTRPLKVMYDAQTIIRVTDVFKTPQSLALEELQAVAGKTLADFKEMSATGLQYAIEQHLTMDLNVNLYAPYIIVPYGGFYKTATSFLILNLGHVYLQSVARDSSQLNVRKMYKKGTAEADILKEVMSQSYDKFLCELKHVQILIARLGEDWQKCIVNNTITEMHLLQPMNLIVQINKSLVPDDPRLPKIKITGCLPSLLLNVTDERVLNILALISSIPLPAGNKVEPAAAQKLKGSTLGVADVEKKPKPLELKNDTQDFVQSTNMDIKFEMTELIVTISRAQSETSDTSHRLLRFKCISLELEMLHQSYNMNVLIRLRGIALTQFRPNKDIEIISTPPEGKDGYLFIIQYTQVNKISPEFHSKYLSCEQRLQLSFETLHLQLHQEGLQYIMKFTNDFQACLARTTEPPPNLAPSSSTNVEPPVHRSSIVEDNVPQPRKSTKLESRKVSRLIQEIILFKLTANMKELNILIANDRHQLSSFAIKGVKSDIVMKKSYTIVMATLKDLTIIDENPQCIHRNMLYRTGKEDALNAQIIMYDNENSSDQQQNDMSVAISTDCMRITFLNYFVNRLLDFLNKFQAAQQAIKDASAAAAESAKQNLQSAFENATRIELKIKLKAPVIIIPTNSKSLDAIMLDLGNISLFNRFINTDPVDEYDNTALLDDAKMFLLDMKISRVTFDEELNNKYECVLLKPLSFNVRVKRNLSTSWYTKIPDLDVIGELKSINFKMSKEDYNKIMQVLRENLGEDPQISTTIPASELQIEMYPVTQTEPRRSSTKTGAQTSVKKSSGEHEEVHCFLRFTFRMESLVVDLFKGGYKTLTENKNLSHPREDGLARFRMSMFDLKGRIMTNNSITTSIKLLDCLLDDTRINCEGNLTRLMERKQDVDEENITDDVNKSMIDIIYQQKDTDMFADVRVFSFNLILNLDYLMKIAAFFSLSEEDQMEAPAKQTNKRAPNSKDTSAPAPDIYEEVTQTTMTVNLRVERPDIILVERMDNIDTNALILNNEMMLHTRFAGTNQSIQGCITNLLLYTCCYNPERRLQTKQHVLLPCNIYIIGSTPRNQGLHMQVEFSDVRLFVSPEIIDLLYRVYAGMYETGSEGSVNEEIDYSNIWKPFPFSATNFRFLRNVEFQDSKHYEAMSYTAGAPTTALSEFGNLNLDSLLVNVGVGTGHNILPMILLVMDFETDIHNWSSNLYIDGTLTTQVAYYNSRQDVWEPFIEPAEVEVENKLVYVPWTLQIEMKSRSAEEYIFSEQTSKVDPMEELSSITASSSIFVSSNVNLELVVTKTSLEVITNFINAFQSVVSTEVTTEKNVIVPYKIINDSGLQVTLLLEHSEFKVCNQKNILEHRDVVLQNGSQVGLELLRKDDSFSTLHIGVKMPSKGTLRKVDKKELLIHVTDMRCTLRLPVARAEKRYFSLNYMGESKESWGLVSEVTVQGAERTVTLRSVLQMHNHFDQPVSVYYLPNRGNYLVRIKKVKAGASFNLPMYAIYTQSSELFFGVEGHCVTSEPYVWVHLQHNLSMLTTLICPGSKYGSDVDFVINVCGDVEHIFYENTCSHTMVSNCYNIHLRPAIIFKNSLPVPVTCIIQGDIEEFIVEPGNKLLMSTVKHGSSYVVLRLDNYLEKLWSCKQQISKNISEFSLWQFYSHDSFVKMRLDLGMHCENKNGTQILSLYCPFWMINKTGLMLSYRNADKNVNVLHHPEDFKGPILFSFPDKSFFKNKKATIRVAYGEWCDKFSLNVAGSSTIIICRKQMKVYHVVVHNQLTYNGLTNLVTFMPFYMVINNASYALEVQEYTRPEDPWLRVQPSSCEPLWPHAESEDFMLVLRVYGTTQVSVPFLINEPHSVLLKLQNKYGGVNVDIQVTEGSIFIKLNIYEAGLAPALILNHTRYQLNFWEKDSVTINHLDPNCKMLYTWENPSGIRQLVWRDGKKKEIENELREDGFGEFYVEEVSKIYWLSFLDGSQRVLLFTNDACIAQNIQSVGCLETIDQEIVTSFHGIGISLVDNYIRQEIMYLSIVSSGIIWEVGKLCSKRYKQLSDKDCEIIEAAYQHYLLNLRGETRPVTIDEKFEIDFKNKTMLKPHKRRIRRTFQAGLWFQMKTSLNQLHMHAKINRIQIDNQMNDCIFPVVLAPVPPPKSVAANFVLKPFAELSIVKQIIQYSTVQQYKYFKLLVQEFHIKVDFVFVNTVLALFQAEKLTEEDESQLFSKDLSVIDEALISQVFTQSMQEEKQFYDYLHFSPLKIHVSFSLETPTSEDGTQSSGLSGTSISGLLNVVMQGFGVTLTDMQDIVLRLGYFQRNHEFLNQNELYTEVYNHYTSQVIQQLYVLVLGLDVIGNPYGLVRGLTKGVEDLFYEPFQGAIQSPGDFAEGFFLGVRSLIGHTVGGAAGAVSRITGTMGKGIAVLTFDEEYQRKRRDQIHEKTANIQEHLARGAKNLVMGLFNGVTGFITKPITGAKQQGFRGFVKGFGKGAVGLVTRPTVGVFDFATCSLDTIRRVTEMDVNVTRLRPARFMRPDGLVRPYLRQEAEGNHLLIELEKGKYANTDVYNYHAWIIRDKSVLLLTNKRLAYLIRNLFGGWQVEWSYTWQHIHMPTKVVDHGIQVTTGEAKKKVFRFHKTNEDGKVIIINDPAAREIVRDKIEQLRNQHFK